MHFDFSVFHGSQSVSGSKSQMYRRHLLTQLAVYGNSEVKRTGSRKALVLFCFFCDAGLLIKHKPDASAGPPDYFSFIKLTHGSRQGFPEILPFPTNALRPGRLKPDASLSDASFWILKPLGKSDGDVEAIVLYAINEKQLRGTTQSLYLAVKCAYTQKTSLSCCF